MYVASAPSSFPILEPALVLLEPDEAEPRGSAGTGRLEHQQPDLPGPDDDDAVTRREVGARDRPDGEGRTVQESSVEQVDPVRQQL